MRSAALIALLPFLATFATAAPSGITRIAHPIRKSLSFGPTHSHATFETLELGPVPEFGLNEFVDTTEIARRFIADKIGSDDFYIRPDTYFDKATGVTHVYAKQLIHGLEVSDGDINVNIDQHGRVLSCGNSFHSGSVPPLDQMIGTSSQEVSRSCEILKASQEAYEAELASAGDVATGAWGLVKSAAQVLLPGFTPKVEGHHSAKVQTNLEKIKHHYEALCSQSSTKAEMLYPVDALVHLLPLIAPESNLDSSISADDFVSTPQHSLTPKAAPNEPPTESISGPGLAKAGVVNDVPARLMLTQTSEGTPRLVWKMEVEMKHNWYEAYVDAITGELLRIVDWANDYTWHTAPSQGLKGGGGGKQKPLPSPPKHTKPYTYQVFPWGINDPQTGNLTTVTEPWDKVASPHGWHQVPTKDNIWSGQHLPGMNATHNVTTFYTTIGNNIIAHEDWEGRDNYLLNYRPVNGNLSFVYDYGEPDGLAPKEYIDFVVTQLFYTSNKYHDLTYRLGFDEISGNFQVSNGDKGGRGGDPVIANAQDGSGYNNANFMTPPDGTPGRMRMYVWDTATPYRDGDIEAGIVIHELSHGLSTRLTGGPANSGCLGFGEAGGMGEGWGDALATLIRQVEEHKLFENGTDIFSMGAWAANRHQGIRNFEYSTNSTINPSTYKTLDKPGYWGVHAIGEVWAEILFSMSQRLVEEYGFSTNLFPPEDTSEPNDYYTKTVQDSVDDFGKPVPLIPKHGNTLAMQLIIDGLKLQPCRPSFFTARDAIIQADQIRTGGANACLIWKAFAERGLGSDATVIGQTPWGGGVRKDGHAIPSKICKKA